MSNRYTTTSRRLAACVISVGLATAATMPAPLAADAPLVALIALASRDEAQVSAFEKGLAENGQVIGKTVRFEARFGNGSRDTMRSQVEELTRAGTRVFVAAGPNVARLIQDISPDAAIVVASLESLETAGVSGSIARPQGNVTGFATLQSDLLAKRLELLRECVPELTKVVAIANPANRNHPHLISAFRAVATRQQIMPSTADISLPDEMAVRLATAASQGVRAVVFLRDFLFESHRQSLVDAANGAGLASTFDEAAFVKIGGLMSYAPDRPDLFRRSAGHVVKILAGANPADIPIELPTKFELVVNIKTARALGIQIPPAILIRADEIIE